MTRKILIAGNWKMHNNVQESIALASVIEKNISDTVDVIISPNFCSLDAVGKIITKCKLAAQNMHKEDKGAYTGETSASMLKAVGCSHVILGHSERRHVFHENNETINKKIKTALKNSLIPILCVGETKEERENGKTLSVNSTQLRSCLEGINASEMSKMIIAYEPVWAIGTGLTASPEQAEEIHAHIRKELQEMYGLDISNQTQILYGGSVKPENTEQLLKQSNIDGALVGGASLQADTFIKIIENAKITVQ